jgi:hypothetical protein
LHADRDEDHRQPESGGVERGDPRLEGLEADHLNSRDAPAPRGHAWTADDDIILAPRDNTSLWHVPASGGRLEPFTTLADGDVSHRWPQALPGGTGVIYTVWSGTWEAAQLVLQPSDGSPRRVLVKGGGYGQVAGYGTRTFIV